MDWGRCRSWLWRCALPSGRGTTRSGDPVHRCRPGGGEHVPGFGAGGAPAGTRRGGEPPAAGGRCPCPSRLPCPVRGPSDHPLSLGCLATWDCRRGSGLAATHHHAFEGTRDPDDPAQPAYLPGGDAARAAVAARGVRRCPGSHPSHKLCAGWFEHPALGAISGDGRWGANHLGATSRSWQSARDPHH